MYLFLKCTLSIIIMLAIKIHESIQEGFSMTKIENTEILLTTKTILKSSDRFGYVKFYVDIRYYTDPKYIYHNDKRCFDKFGTYHISEACFSALYFVMMKKIVELLTGMNQVISAP